MDTKGKTILITGATSGIGKATAKGLAELGASLIIAGRDRERCEKTIEEIRSVNPGIEISYFLADLSSLKEIRELAEEVKKNYNKLDVLINNAGSIFDGRKTSADGYEYTFAFDHLSPFLLTGLLLDLLKKGAPSRIITVSSSAHRSGKIAFDDLMLEQSYSSFRAYSQAKIANVLFTYELARRLEGKDITSNALHPGVVNTHFGNEFKGVLKALMKLMRPFFISPEKGAETSIYLASSQEVQGMTGRYFMKKKPVKSAPLTYDLKTAEKLWKVSEELTGYSYRF